MPKPIFIVQISNHLSPMHVEKLHHELKENKDLCDDYHVLVAQCLPTSLDGLSKEMEFQLFNAKDVTEIQFEELKEIVKSFNKDSDEVREEG